MLDCDGKLNRAAVFRHTLILGAMLAALCSYAGAQEVHDEFAAANPDPNNWFVCQRDESEFHVEDVANESFRALRTTVNSRPEIDLFSLRVHRECHLNDDPNDSYERAEIWEADESVQPLSKEIWYRFSMFVDPAVKPEAKRLVIGQWKEAMSDREGDFSPVLAQLFTSRKFVLTIEQDNDQPGHNPDDISCRVVIATDRAPVLMEQSVLGFDAVAEKLSKLSSVGLLSIGHDNLDVTHQLEVSSKARDEGCARDLTVEHFDDLPDPFGHWITMKYHLVLSTTNGVIEVWANGVPIVKVTGRIGYRTTDTHAKQYFKFGPYRNHEGISAFALLAHYARGAKESAVK